MTLIALAALGGAIGSAARFMLVTATAKAFGGAFPVGTLLVNVVGCFAMGLVVEAIARKGGSREAAVFFATGVLGGFTTFSAFALDYTVLMSREAAGAAHLYVLASVLASLIAIYGGLALGRSLWP
ncbi:MAG: fluoride efflux transporter CrcB [Hyphomicrobiales bacterium]|nr:fluoride efflux transporter CrcB [Hyphomicrobiales bacterium]